MSQLTNKDKVSTAIILAMASIAPTLALILAWVADQWLGSTHWMARFGMVSLAIGISSLYGFYMVRRWLNGHCAAREYMDILSRADIGDLQGISFDNIVDDLSPTNTWISISERIRKRIVELQELVTELEMTKMSTEIRARRSASEHDRIATILNSLSDPVLAVDEYDELVLANPSATTLFNLDSPRDEKRMLADIIHCESLVELLTDTRRRRTAQKRTCEFEFKNADGETQWFRATACNLPVNDGDESRNDFNSLGAAAILQDIGSHKEIQKQNAQFVSSVSHEMKTPLAGIKAHVELLTDGDADDAETHDAFLEIISSQTDRLQRLVENLLNIARIEAGVVQVSKDETSLNDILSEALGVVTHLAESKEIKLVSDLSNMYLGVYVDRDMMLQAAINLLSNAIKYTPNGRRVTLRSRLVGSSVEFEVEDKGVGLSDEDRIRVFEKFFRVNRNKSMASGTGLGLPLAKHIIEDVHQGQLSVKSELDVGSTFTVQLPGTGKIS